MLGCPLLATVRHIDTPYIFLHCLPSRQPPCLPPSPFVRPSPRSTAMHTTVQHCTTPPHRTHVCCRSKRSDGAAARGATTHHLSVCTTLSAPWSLRCRTESNSQLLPSPLLAADAGIPLPLGSVVRRSHNSVCSVVTTPEAVVFFVKVGSSFTVLTIAGGI